MFEEPGAGHSQDMVERACLFEQMARVRNDDQASFARHASGCFLVQREHIMIIAAYHKQGRSGHMGQGLAGEIRTTAPRHDGLHV